MACIRWPSLGTGISAAWLIHALVWAAAGLGAGEIKEFPNMAPRVGEILEHEYYDKSVFRTRILVERALRALEDAEISIDARWKDDEITLNIAGTKTVVPARVSGRNEATEGDDRRNQALRDAMDILEKVRGVLAGADFPAKRRRELEYALLNGALNSLDPHTVILPPEVAQDFSEDIQGGFFGIGAVLREDEGVVFIERVLPGLPADRAGVEDGDVVLAVDGEKTAGLSLPQTVKRIKGPKGTTVRLLVERKGAKAPIEIPIRRDLVSAITELAWRDPANPDVGYIQLDEFNAKTNEKLRIKLMELDADAAGPIKALVLDLRFNGGGLLEQAKLVSDCFLLKPVEVVRTVTSAGRMQRLGCSGKPDCRVPMLVLVSGGTASAAEIVSGALQRHDRAAVAGVPTFGKGTVQTIAMLRDDSRLKYTIQEYQLPGGVSIQRVGVNPDLRFLSRNQAKDGTIDLLPYIGRREADDEFAIASNHAYRHESSLALAWLRHYETRDQQRTHFISAKKFSPDAEAQMAIELVQAAIRDPAAPAWDAAAAAAEREGKQRQFLIERLRRPTAARSEAESTALAKALLERKPPLTWGDLVEPAASSLELAFTGPAEIQAKDTNDGPPSAEIGFSVSNRSDKAFGRLYGVAKADRGSPLWQSEVIFGAVQPGAKAAGTMHLTLPPRLEAGEERFTLELYADGREQPLTSLPVRLTIKPRQRPHLGFRWKIEDDKGTGMLKVDEDARLRLSLFNDGKVATSGRIEVAVFKDNDPFVELKDTTRFTVDPIEVGGRSRELVVPFRIRKSRPIGPGRSEDFKATEIKLQFRASERLGEDGGWRGAAEVFSSLKIDLDRPLEEKIVLQPQFGDIRVSPEVDGKVRLVARISDDNLKFVSCFLDKEKIDLRPTRSMDPVPTPPGAPVTRGGVAVAEYPYEVELALKPGVNPVRIVAAGADDVDEVAVIRLWGADKPVATRPAASQPEIAPVP